MQETKVKGVLNQLVFLRLVSTQVANQQPPRPHNVMNANVDNCEIKMHSLRCKGFSVHSVDGRETTWETRIFYWPDR